MSARQSPSETQKRADKPAAPTPQPLRELAPREAGAARAPTAGAPQPPPPRISSGFCLRKGSAMLSEIFSPQQEQMRG
ncbi:hypothetical protein CapIbe_006716 [Capra ibex]